MEILDLLKNRKVLLIGGASLIAATSIPGAGGLPLIGGASKPFFSTAGAAMVGAGLVRSHPIVGALVAVGTLYLYDLGNA